MAHRIAGTSLIVPGVAATASIDSAYHVIKAASKLGRSDRR